MDKNLVRKTVKIAGALAAATGVVAISALVASGAAVGAVAEGFKEAGKVVKKSLDKAAQEKNDIEETDGAEEVTVEKEQEILEAPETVVEDITSE